MVPVQGWFLEALFPFMSPISPPLKTDKKNNPAKEFGG